MEIKYKNLKRELVTGNVKTRLDYSEVCAFVMGVVDAVVSKEGKYRPYMRPVAYLKFLLMSYTDVEIKEVDTMMRYAKETDLFEEVARVVDADQLDQMKSWIDEMIEHEKNRTGMDRLAEKMIVLGDNAGNTVKGLWNDKRVSKIIQKLSDMDFDMETFAKLLKANA